MIGLTSTSARDSIEWIGNGLCDEDLDAIDAAIVSRRKLLQYPACPVCGEALEGPHVHDDIVMARFGTMTQIDERNAE